MESDKMSIERDEEADQKIKTLLRGKKIFKKY